MKTKPGISLIAAILIAAALPAHSEMMNAIVAHEYGGPEVLKLEQVPVPAPKDNEC